jgi:cell division protein FtsN
MKYSTPQGMSTQERARTLRRLGGGTIPNASGATSALPSPLIDREAVPAPLEPTEPLTTPALTPEQQAVADANRVARQHQINAELLK